MADDIVNQLRDTAYEVDLCWDAAAEIERLRMLTQDLVCLLPHFHLAIRCKAPASTTLDEWCSECAAIARWEARRG